MRPVNVTDDATIRALCEEIGETAQLEKVEATVRMLAAESGTPKVGATIFSHRDPVTRRVTSRVVRCWAGFHDADENGLMMSVVYDAESAEGQEALRALIAHTNGGIKEVLGVVDLDSSVN